MVEGRKPVITKNRPKGSVFSRVLFFIKTTCSRSLPQLDVVIKVLTCHTEGRRHSIRKRRITEALIPENNSHNSKKLEKKTNFFFFFTIPKPAWFGISDIMAECRTGGANALLSSCSMGVCSTFDTETNTPFFYAHHYIM